MSLQPEATWVWQETGRVREGADDFAGLEWVVREHSRFLFKVAYGVLHNSHDAEDVVQEAFLRVHRSGTKGITDIRAWLASIAFRLAVDRTRKLHGIEVTEVDLPAEGPDAETVAIHRQRVTHVQKLIAALPEELRHPLVLSALEELTSRQIGEVLGIPESSVRGRILRARHLLKEKLAVLTEEKS